MKTGITWLSGLLGVALAMSGLPVQASTAWSWTLDETPGAGMSGTVSAYKAPNNTTPLSSATAMWYGDSYGMGVCGYTGDSCSDVPQHAMDNDGSKESLLLSFSEQVSLNSFSVGWAQEEGSSTPRADVSVLAYTGSGTPITTGTGGTTYNTMLSSGWTLIGNYGNVGDYSTKDISSNTVGISSSYWLIAAYNLAFGGCSTCSSSSSSNDFVKIIGVAGTKEEDQQVPEPGSLLLVAAPLIAMALRRRRET